MTVSVVIANSLAGRLEFRANLTEGPFGAFTPDDSPSYLNLGRESSQFAIGN